MVLNVNEDWDKNKMQSVFSTSILITFRIIYFCEIILD